jgi:hypothetical protein
MQLNNQFLNDQLDLEGEDLILISLVLKQMVENASTLAMSGVSALKRNFLDEIKKATIFYRNRYQRKIYNVHRYL